MQTTHKIPGDSATRYAKYLTSTATRGDYYTRDGEDERRCRAAGTARRTCCAHSASIPRAQSSAATCAR